MDKIKIAICDDEPNIRSYLAALIQKQDKACEITQYASAEACLSDRPEWDLLFLDIELHGSTLPCPFPPGLAASADSGTPAPMDGLTLAKRLRTGSGKQPLIIFVTGHEKYVYDAFDVEAFQYLLKPISESRFQEVFQRAAAKIDAMAGFDIETRQQQRKLMIQSAGSNKIIPLDNIYYMESQGHKILLHPKDGSLEYYGKLGILEQELQGQFCRIHKGYLINLAYVEEYTRTQVTMANGDALMVSKYKYNDFVKAHLRFIG